MQQGEEQPHVHTMHIHTTIIGQTGYKRYTYALATIDRAITADGGTHIICVAGVLEPECAYTGAWAIAKMATGLRLTDEHRDVDTGAPT